MTDSQTSSPTEPRYRVDLQGRDIGSEPEYFWVAEKMEIMVWRGPDLKAVVSICPHMGGKLKLANRNTEISCPWHGLTFSVNDFKSRHHCYKTVRAFKVEMVNGELRIY